MPTRRETEGDVPYVRARLRYEPGGGQTSILVVLVTGPDGRAVMGAIQDSTDA